MNFEELGLCPELLKGIEEKGYKKATPIQAKAVPAVLNGSDVLGGAQTGTGKTAAFALPILELLSRYSTESLAPRALILTPTRELSDQVGESFTSYGKYLDLKSTKIFGGVKFSPQQSNLEKGTDIVIATPGRLMDHIRQKTIDLSHIKILVLDEADRMLDMGFINDIKEIIESLPWKRQNLLFSATYGSDIENLAQTVLTKPIAIEVTKRNTAAEEVEQRIHFVDKKQRFDLLAHLIKEGSWYQVLIFVKTKHGAERLNSQLLKSGIPSSAIHGDKSQGARSRALKQFKTGDLQALVATDVAARGIDLHDLSHVVNFELPQIPEDYIHRIGRTGRAGKSGIAISLVSFSEKNQLKKIEKILKYTIPQSLIEGFEPKHDINKDLKKDKTSESMKEKIIDNKRSRSLKQKTSRTPKPKSKSGRESDKQGSNSSRSSRPKFKSTRSNDQHGGQTRSDKSRSRSSRQEERKDNRNSNSRSGKPGSRNSRTDDSRSRNIRTGKPDSRPSRSDDNRSRNTRTGKPDSRPSRSDDNRSRNTRTGKPGSRPSKSSESRSRTTRSEKTGFSGSRSNGNKSRTSKSERSGPKPFKSNGSRNSNKGKSFNKNHTSKKR